MVAPKTAALGCSECHAKVGRLSELNRFYMPGRDGFGWLDVLGYLAVIGALLVALVHGVIRFVMCKKRITEHCKAEE